MEAQGAVRKDPSPGAAPKGGLSGSPGFLLEVRAQRCNYASFLATACLFLTFLWLLTAIQLVHLEPDNTRDDVRE